MLLSLSPAEERSSSFSKASANTLSRQRLLSEVVLRDALSCYAWYTPPPFLRFFMKGQGGTRGGPGSWFSRTVGVLGVGIPRAGSPPTSQDPLPLLTKSFRRWEAFPFSSLQKACFLALTYPGVLWEMGGIVPEMLTVSRVLFWKRGRIHCSSAPNFQGFTKGWFPKGWFWRMFPGTKNRNEGTFGCSPVPKTRTRVHSPYSPAPKTGTRVHSPKPPFYETTLLFPLETW